MASSNHASDTASNVHVILSGVSAIHQSISTGTGHNSHYACNVPQALASAKSHHLEALSPGQESGTTELQNKQDFIGDIFLDIKLPKLTADSNGSATDAKAYATSTYDEADYGVHDLQAKTDAATGGAAAGSNLPAYKQFALFNAVLSLEVEMGSISVAKFSPCGLYMITQLYGNSEQKGHKETAAGFGMRYISSKNFGLEGQICIPVLGSLTAAYQKWPTSKTPYSGVKITVTKSKLASLVESLKGADAGAHNNVSFAGGAVYPAVACAYECHTVSMPTKEAMANGPACNRAFRTFKETNVGPVVGGNEYTQNVRETKAISAIVTMVVTNASKLVDSGPNHHTADELLEWTYQVNSNTATAPTFDSLSADKKNGGSKMVKGAKLSNTDKGDFSAALASGKTDSVTVQFKPAKDGYAVIVSENVTVVQLDELVAAAMFY